LKTLVTGATGFTGEKVLPLLARKGKIRCFVRTNSNVEMVNKLGYELAYGDLGDVDSLKAAMSECSALINIASLGFGHAYGIVKTAERVGIERALFVSTTALFTQLNVNSKSVRQEAEGYIKRSKLDWTILRPTMIYGSSRDRNMCRLVGHLKKWPVMPMPGSGENLQQPVYVDDVARAIVDAVSTDRTIRKSYNIPGLKALTFKEVVETISNQLGRKILKVNFPISPFVKLLRLCESYGLTLPIKAEQILRLNEDKAFDLDDAKRDFGYAPRSFREGIAVEIKEMYPQITQICAD